MNAVDPDRSEGDHVLVARLLVTTIGGQTTRTAICVAPPAGADLDMAERMFNAQVTVDPYSTIVLEAPDGTELLRHDGHEGWGDALA